MTLARQDGDPVPVVTGTYVYILQVLKLSTKLFSMNRKKETFDTKMFNHVHIYYTVPVPYILAQITSCQYSKTMIL
jgi:hypothetical protein